MDRRRYLTTVAGGFTAVSGCRSIVPGLGEQPSTTPSSVTESEDVRSCPGPVEECQYIVAHTETEQLVTGSITLESALASDRKRFATLLTDRADAEERVRHLGTSGEDWPHVPFVNATDFSTTVVLVAQHGAEPNSQEIILEEVTLPDPDRLHARIYEPQMNGGEGPTRVPTVMARVPIGDHSPSQLTIALKAPYFTYGGGSDYGSNRDVGIIDTFSMAETDPHYPSN